MIPTEDDEILLSGDIAEVKFACDLNACKGACCLVGDAGAPLLESEVEPLSEAYQAVKHLLPTINLETINQKGIYETDPDGDLVTTTIGTERCVFVIDDENGVAKCAIEKGYFDGLTHFRKPISCHLYPIRVTRYPKFDALNYHQNSICKPALKNGEKLNLKLYQFLSEPLIRLYGEEWYNGLVEMLENDNED